MNENGRFFISLLALVCTLLFPSTLHSQPGTTPVSPPLQTGSHIDFTPALLKSLSDRSASSDSPYAASPQERQAAVASFLDTQFHFSPALQATNVPHNLTLTASPDAVVTITPRPDNDPASAMTAPEPRPVARTCSFKTTAINGIGVDPQRPLADGDTLTTQITPQTLEWFVNSPEGIEHGYTVTAPPDLTGTLKTDITVTTDLSPALAADTVTFSSTGGTIAFTYSHLNVYDATGAPLPAHLELVDNGSGAHTIRVVTDTSGAAYPVTVAPIVTTGGNVLAPSDNAPNSFTGIATATTETISVTGDPFNSGAGAAYVYERDHPTPGAWQEVKRLTHPEGNQFGRSVAIAGTTVFVGSPNNNTAYVFERDHGSEKNYGFVTSLTPPFAAFDNVGWHMSAHGDTLAVGANSDIGAPYDDVNPDDAGSVHTYRRAGALALFLFVSLVVMPTPEASALFGHAVAITWLGELFVGAHQATDGGIRSGLAFLFTFSPVLLAFAFASVIKPANRIDGQFFAYNIAVAATVILLGSPFLNQATGGAFRFGLSAQLLTVAQWLPLSFAVAVLNNPLLQATVWGNLADPNGNGVPNLIEYLVGGNPLEVGTPPLSVLTLATTVILTLALARYVSGVQGNRYQLVLPLIAFAALQMRLAAISE